MELQITIEVDDRAPNVELCGKNCIGRGRDKYFCLLFDEKLEDYCHNKADMENDTVVYEKIQEIDGQKRCKRCIDKFYQFCSAKNG